MDSKQKWSDCLLQTCFSLTSTLIIHPVTCARTLMQLNYEPAQPYLGHTLKSLIGKGEMEYKFPSVFGYCTALGQKIGWKNLFLTGLPANVLCTYLKCSISEIVHKHATGSVDQLIYKSLDTDRDFNNFLTDMFILASSKLAGIMISFPFEVIMIRQIAEMREIFFDPINFLDIIKEIFSKDGIPGFYKGVSSKITGELLLLSATGSLIYLINRCLLSKQNNELRSNVPFIVNVLVDKYTYRFQVITTLMIIPQSKVSGPFPNIKSAYSYLSESNGFYRGWLLVFSRAVGT